MSTKFLFQYGYCRLNSWQVRTDNGLIFMSRRDDYDLYGNLVRLGNPEVLGTLELNGWEPSP